MNPDYTLIHTGHAGEQTSTARRQKTLCYADSGMRYLHLTASSRLPELHLRQPCKLVLIVEASVTPERRAAVSEWLVASGCLYAMVWGQDSIAWQNAIQAANQAAFPCTGDEEIPSDKLVMITRHDHEPLSEVFWFSKYTAMHPCSRLNQVMLLHLAPAPRETDLCDAYGAV